MSSGASAVVASEPYTGPWGSFQGQLLTRYGNGTDKNTDAATPLQCGFQHPAYLLALPFAVAGDTNLLLSPHGGGLRGLKADGSGSVTLDKVMSVFALFGSE